MRLHLDLGSTICTAFKAIRANELYSAAPSSSGEGDPVGSERGQLSLPGLATLADTTEFRSVFACKLSFYSVADL